MTGGNVGAAIAWRQVLRIPAVVALLVAAGQLSEATAEGIVRLQIGAVWRVWVPQAVLGAAVAALIVTGRDREHHPAVLVLEALIAGLLGFVPAVQWIVWFGLTGIVGSTFAHTGAGGFIQALGIVWFVTALVTAAKQLGSDGKRRVDSSET